MNMQNTRSLLPCSRTTLLLAACVIGGVNAPLLAGGEHTDFPDLSIITPPNKGNGYQAPKKIFDAIVGWVPDGEGNMVVNDGIIAPTFPPPNFPPKPTLPEHGYTLEPAGSQTSGGVGSNFSGVPAPGVGTLVVVGAVAAGLRRRRR